MPNSDRSIEERSEAHVRLTPDEIKELWKSGRLTATGLLYLLIRVSRQDGSRLWIDNVRLFCKDCDIPKTSFYRALTDLEACGELPLEFSSRTPIRVEQVVRDRLHESLGGMKEVVTAVGRIDLLTDSEVIEVKGSGDWKGALGQVLAYGSFYPTHSKRIHLFSERAIAAEYASQISVTCLELGVVVTFEHIAQAALNPTP